MTVVTKTQLENASLDAESLSEFVNGPNSGPTSLVTTRLGEVYKTASRIALEATAGGGALADLSNVDPSNVDTTSLFVPGNPVAVAGVSLGYNWSIENSPYSMASYGGIYPTSAYFGWGVNKDWTVSNAPGTDVSPAATWMVLATNSGAGPDVVGELVIADNRTAGKGVFAQNLIASTRPNLANVKLVCTELDLVGEAGCTYRDSASIIANVFTGSNIGPIIFASGISGGTYSNGFLIGALSSTASGYSIQSGTSCSAASDFSQGTYSTAAIILAASHNIKWGTSTNIRSNGSGDLQHNAERINLIDSLVTTQGSIINYIRNGTANASVEVQSTTYVGLGNAAASAMRVCMNSINSRSINAPGTINAAGADYAEYERKAVDCGKIIKGQIVGFDANGFLTDKWEDSISFGVKSTNPNLVGGDNWTTELGERPIAPEAPFKVERLKPERIVSNRDFYGTRVIKDNEGKEHKSYGVADKIDVDYKKACDEWEAEIESYKAAKAQYDQEHETWKTANAVFENSLETLRECVDRIAYCGKVPVNVLNASPGQLIIAVNNNGKISGEARSYDKTTAEERDLFCVGRVRRILSDGRPEIIIKL